MKKIVSAVLLTLCACLLFAQVSVDPNDEFYSLAQNWQIRNLVDSVPPLRPYPLGNIRQILETVIENGNEKDKEEAQLQYERIFSKKYHVNLEAKITSKTEITDDDTDNSACLEIYPSVKGDVSFSETDFVSCGYGVGFAIRNKDDTDFAPMYTNSLHDSIVDPTEISSFNMFLDMNTILAVGTKDIFLQAGIYRTGFGMFQKDEIAVNSSAYHSANLGFTYLRDKFSYAQELSMIGATASQPDDLEYLSPNKFRSFHEISFSPWDWVSVSYYESVIFGGRFDPSYLLPVPYMVAQGIGGTADGLFMGLVLDFKPARGLVWSTDILVDDFPVEDFLKLDFDSKYRMAFKTGIIYAPENSFCQRLSLDYTFVTPYTYSHWQYDNDEDATIKASTINYQNYTNGGINMGSQYGPNSDALKFQVDVSPVRNLKLSIVSSFARHANVCESITDLEALEYLCAGENVYSTDGSVFTHANFANPGKPSGKHVNSAWNHLNFLNQSHTMVSVNAGLNGEYKFTSIKKGPEVTFKAGAVFEFIHNYGVDNQMFPGGVAEGVYVDEYLTGMRFADGTYYDLTTVDGLVAASQLVESYRKSWEDQLVDQLNLFFSFGFALRF